MSKIDARIHGSGIVGRALALKLARQGLANKLGNVSMASLDHAMWFERTFRADEWLLYTMHSPSASGGRALATGRFHRQDGTLVCSVVQEGLVRLRG